MRRGFLCLLMALMPLLALAQWDRPVPLTDDNFNYVASRFLVDDSLRLHVFTLRSLEENDLQPRVLTYLRFNSWGQLLGPAMPLAIPDTLRDDELPAVLLDRDGCIRVIWGRLYWGTPGSSRLFYARFRVDGSLMDGPRDLDPNHLLPYPPFADPQLVQAPDGTLWYASGEWCASFDEQMNPHQSFQPMLPAPVRVVFTQLAGAPDGSIWAAVNADSVGTGDPLFVGLVRLDSAAAGLELVTVAANDLMFVGVASFFIDSAGVFHYALWRDDVGLYYQRDARNGSGPDTLGLFESSWSSGLSRWTLVGGDTLMLLEGGDRPISFQKFGVSVQGERLFVEGLNHNGQFSLEGSGHLHRWKRGSHWVLGRYRDPDQHTLQLTMLHVPGPNEPPPSAVEEPLPRTSSPQLKLSTLALGDYLRLRVDGLPMIPATVTLYNVLGQRALRVTVTVGDQSALVPLPAALPSGIYFLKVQTSRGEFGGRFLHVK